MTTEVQFFYTMLFLALKILIIFCSVQFECCVHPIVLDQYKAASQDAVDKLQNNILIIDNLLNCQYSFYYCHDSITTHHFDTFWFVQIRRNANY